jgi:hypothetical protein
VDEIPAALVFLRELNWVSFHRAQLGTNPGDAGIFLLPLNGHPIGLVQSQPSNLM